MPSVERDLDILPTPQIHPTEVELVIVQIAVETQVIQVGQVNNPPLWQPIYMVKSYHLPVPMILS